MIPIVEIAARLRDLLAGPPPAEDVSVSGITDDSRDVGPGDLYCAIPGLTHDGHDFVAAAQEAGAVAALVERPLPECSLPQIRVTNSRRATAVAAQVVYGDPAGDLTLIGITGTNGKTTTAWLARHVLAQRWATAALGTLGMISPFGARESMDLTTPAPVELARRLRQLSDQGAAYVVMEVSSHALAQERVDGIEFEVAAFTNLSRDHLDYHSDLEEYRDTKLRLATLVHEDGAVVANAEEPAWSELLRDPRAVSYADDGQYHARSVDAHLRDSRFELVAPDGAAEVRLPLAGGFNVANALAAAAIAGSRGMKVAAIAEALASTGPVPGRMEVLAESPVVLRDFAHTPEALRRLLAAVRPLTEGRVLLVFGCGGERDRGKRPLMGRVAAEGADYTIVTSDNPRGEDPGAIIAQIVPGLDDAPHVTIEDRREAIARALALAEAHDVVVLAGKGHETYQVVDGERRPFDEATVVAELRSADGGDR